MRLQLQAPRPRARSKNAPQRPHPCGDRKIVTLRLVGGVVVLFGLLCLLGELLAHVLNTGPFHHVDRGIDVWFAAHRTGFFNGVTLVGTTMAQTETVIAIAAVVVLILRWRLGRWYESLVLITIMAGELVIFLGVTEVVHRPRPTVVRLDAAPPTSSFPSGHTAAALALYGGIAILVRWIYGRRRATLIAAIVLFCVPVYVGLSRLYRGMHYPTDVLAGALLSGLWLLIVISTLLPQWNPNARQRAVRRKGDDLAVR